MSDNLNSFLSDSNCDFLVVGVLGPQGAGKSAVLNALAGEREAPPGQKDKGGDVFRVQVLAALHLK